MRNAAIKNVIITIPKRLSIPVAFSVSVPESSEFLKNDTRSKYMVFKAPESTAKNTVTIVPIRKFLRNSYFAFFSVYSVTNSYFVSFS